SARPSILAALEGLLHPGKAGHCTPGKRMARLENAGYFGFSLRSQASELCVFSYLFFHSQSSPEARRSQTNGRNGQAEQPGARSQASKKIGPFPGPGRPPVLLAA